MIRHHLEYEKAVAYFEDRLADVNAISSELVKSLDFQKGSFFTLLPDDANLEGLYKFEVGGILPQNPVREQLVNGQKSYYQEITNKREEIAAFILNKMQLNPTLQFVSDDYNAAPTHKKLGDLYAVYGFLYVQEVYYHLKSSHAKVELIKKCLNKSNVFWHSLCLLTEADFSIQSDKQVSLESIKQIAAKAQLVFVGAYDGEGYVFWEPLEGQRGYNDNQR